MSDDIVRYAVYTMRRTSSRTVYAIYDAYKSQPVCKEGTNQPVTTTDKRKAQEIAWKLERAQ